MQVGPFRMEVIEPIRRSRVILDDKGEPLVREGLEAPLYETEAAIPGVEDGLVERSLTARHRLEYAPGTRIAKFAEIDLVSLAQQVVRATNGEREGVGVLETLIIGPYLPGGFKSFFDGYRP